MSSGGASAPTGFKKKLYLVEPTAEELAADAAEEERRRKAEEKAAKKIALPFVPASVAAAAKRGPSISKPTQKQKPPSNVPHSSTTDDSSSTVVTPPAPAIPLSNTSSEPPAKKQRTENNFSAHVLAQIQAEREEGVTYAFDNRPKAQRGGKAHKNKKKTAEPTYRGFDVTKYNPPDTEHLDNYQASWSRHLRQCAKKKKSMDEDLSLPISPPSSRSPSPHLVAPSSKPIPLQNAASQVSRPAFAPPAEFSEPGRQSPLVHLSPPVAQPPRAAVSTLLPAHALPTVPAPNIIRAPLATNEGKTVEEQKANALDMAAKIRASLAAKAAASASGTTQPAAPSLAPPSGSPLSHPPPVQNTTQFVKSHNIGPSQSDYSSGPVSAERMNPDTATNSTRAQPDYSAAPMSAADLPRDPSREEQYSGGSARQAKGSKFGERMLQKMGWEKGKGLGANSDGITTAIVAKAEKRKKLADHEGGGYATPANMGKIVGGKKPKTQEDPADNTGDTPRPAPLSQVVKLSNMFTGMDVTYEIEQNDVLQEIGDDMGRYGTVERIFVWRETSGGDNGVFVKFNDRISALKAMQDAGAGELEFGGNVVKAEYWDVERFENGEYA